MNNRVVKALIFGAGDNLRLTLDKTIDSGYEIVAIIDNDEKKQGKIFHYDNRDFIVESPQIIKELSFDLVIVSVIYATYQYALTKQLVRLGVSSDNIFTWYGAEFVQLKFPDILGTLEWTHENIFFDVSSITQYDGGTGVQRVVNKLYLNLCRISQIKITPIRWLGEYVTSDVYHCRLNHTDYTNTESRICLKNNDKILLADLSLLEVPSCLSEIRKSGGISYVIVYDLLPLLIRDLVPDAHKRNFKRYIDSVLKFADNVICISKTVAHDVFEYMQANNIVREKELRIHWFHLGFDISASTGNPRPIIDEFRKRIKTLFLLVGTISPHKNQELALRALAKVSVDAPEANIGLLIIGHSGWKDQGFKDMLLHDGVRNHVLWLQDATDFELEYSYKIADALLFPSQNEGFGLPLVEAAYQGLQILCSDIPIFRELAGDNAEYFTLTNEDELSKSMMQWDKENNHPDSGNIRLYTWQECTEEILNILNDITDPYIVVGKS